MSDNPADRAWETTLATTSPVNSKTYLPGRRFYGVLLVVTILGFLVQWKAEWIAESFPFAGRALSNILILPLILIALISWMRWFLFGISCLVAPLLAVVLRCDFLRAITSVRQFSLAPSQ